jgi:hypothetical protein
MDLAKVLAQLRLELDHLDAAIHSLEHLQEQATRTPGTKIAKSHRRTAVLRKMDEPAGGRRQADNLS